jgi:hypothetical protein
MKSRNHFNFYRVMIILFFTLFMIPIAAAQIIEEKGYTYLIDQTGERWDITQAVSIGFEPREFEFGIGRNAFRPLSESDWSNRGEPNFRNFRVIGVTDGDEAHAYAVSKLSRHEIANTMLGSEPVAAGY